jgi:hypothetical protein
MGLMSLALVGRRQAVFMTGEPGIGKDCIARPNSSRVCDALRHGHFYER